jgi:hypothetical protein
MLVLDDSSLYIYPSTPGHPGLLGSDFAGQWPGHSPPPWPPKVSLSTLLLILLLEAEQAHLLAETRTVVRSIGWSTPR